MFFYILSYYVPQHSWVNNNFAAESFKMNVLLREDIKSYLGFIAYNRFDRELNFCGF